MEKVSLIVLAGGKGARFKPFTDNIPKPLLRIAGKPSLEYNLDSALPFINEIIIVVGHLKERIINLFGNFYKGIPIKYIEQTEQLGTGHAVAMVRDLVSNDSFLLIYGDDIYDTKLFEAISGKSRAVLGKKEANWQNFGVFQIKDKKYLDKIIEKPQQFVGDLVNIGVYKLDKNIFDYYEKIKKSIRGEYEFTDMLTLYAQDYLLEVIECKEGWIPLSYPWNILDAAKLQLERMETKIEGTIEQGVKLEGKLRLGKNSVIKTGSSLKGNFWIGDNCLIDENCTLEEYAVIGDGCKIMKDNKILRSSIGNHIVMKEGANIADSLIGSRVVVGRWAIVEGQNNDGSNIYVEINERLVDTGRSHFGAIVGDGLMVLESSLLPPGAVLTKKPKSYL